ncbi:MAG: phage holin family protein [Candidatus Jorgensenbacteria bacterium]
MGFIATLIFAVFSNTIALLIADYAIPGFSVVGGIVAFLTAGAILTIINTLLRPLLKLFLGPFIVLTLGLFAIVINALTFYLLDVLSPQVTIQGYLPLLLATLLVGAVNLILGFARRKH